MPRLLFISNANDGSRHSRLPHYPGDSKLNQCFVMILSNAHQLSAHLLEQRVARFLSIGM